MTQSYQDLTGVDSKIHHHKSWNDGVRHHSAGQAGQDRWPEAKLLAHRTSPSSAVAGWLGAGAIWFRRGMGWNQGKKQPGLGQFGDGRERILVAAMHDNILFPLSDQVPPPESPPTCAS